MLLFYPGLSELMVVLVDTLCASFILSRFRISMFRAFWMWLIITAAGLAILMIIALGLSFAIGIHLSMLIHGTVWGILTLLFLIGRAAFARRFVARSVTENPVAHLKWGWAIAISVASFAVAMILVTLVAFTLSPLP